MKKLLSLFLSITSALCLSSCIFFRDNTAVLEKAGFGDFVEPQADYKKESKYITLYKMTNQEYTDYMQTVYDI